MLDEVTILSGQDIFSEELNLTFCQPTLSQIALMGFKRWDRVVNLLFFDKARLEEDEKLAPEEVAQIDALPNFAYVYCYLNDAKLYEFQQDFKDFCVLVFPYYDVDFRQLEKTQIAFFPKDKDAPSCILNADNYDIFLHYIKTLFLKEADDGSEYNIDEKDAKAKEMMEKIKKRHKILAEQHKDRKTKHSILYNRISSLAIGLGTSARDIMNKNTLYQFYEAVGRFQARESYIMSVKAAMVGADVELKPWYDDIE